MVVAASSIMATPSATLPVGGDEDVVGLEEDAGADADTHDQADRGEQRVALHRRRVGVDGGGLGGRCHGFLSQASHADAHIDGFGGEGRGGCESVYAGGGIFPRVFGVDAPAAMMVRRGSSARRLPISSASSSTADLVELDAVDADPGNGPARGGAGTRAGGVVHASASACSAFTSTNSFFSMQRERFGAVARMSASIPPMNER